MEQKTRPESQNSFQGEKSTSASLPEPTISSKLEGVNSTTLLATTPLKIDEIQAKIEKRYIKERILSQCMQGKFAVVAFSEA
jgi:hypothetical protein